MLLGWIRLHRKIREHELWTRDRFSRAQAWLDLLLTAAFEDHEAFVVHGPTWVKRGQVLTTKMALAKRWQWNRETVRLYLRELERHAMTATETSKASATGYTLITILNYEKYQGGVDDESVIGSAIAPAIQSAIGQPSASHVIRRSKKEKKTTTTAAAFFQDPGQARNNGHTETAPRWPSPEALVADFNRLVPAGHPKVRVLSPALRRDAQEALEKFPDQHYWDKVFSEVQHCPLLRGLRPSKEHPNFKATFAWLLAGGRKPGTLENHVKVYEGNYRDPAAAPEDEE